MPYLQPSPYNPQATHYDSMAKLIPKQRPNSKEMTDGQYSQVPQQVSLYTWNHGYYTFG